MSMYKAIIVRLSIILILLFAALLAVRAEAFTLEELSINYGNFIGPNRNAYFVQEQKDRISIDARSRFLHYGFFNTLVHGTSDDSQYRLIGLKFELGVRLGIMDVFYQHHSQHLLDTSDQFGRGFPVEDTLNVKLYLYKEK